ncbi:MAG: hypothetical protein U0Z53_11465 [Blastocatellia bacterium]
MKHYLYALLTAALIFQPLPAVSQTPVQQSPPGAQAAPSRSETESKAVAIEELLPATTMLFVATTNLSGLLEGFKRLEAFKTLSARLPKSEREGEDNPLDLATRFLGMGIKDAAVLDDARLGLAYLQPDFPPELTVATDASRRATTRQRLADADALRIPDPQFIAFIEAGSPEHAKQAREQFITYFSENFTDLGKPAEAKPVKDAKYKGASVERFKNGWLGALIGGTFVTGEAAAIERIIRLREATDVEHLSDNQNYVQSRARLLTPTGLFAWVNGRTLDAYTSLATKNVPGFLSAISGSLFAPEAIRSIALASTFERGGVTDRLLVSLNPAKKNLLGTLFGGPATDFRATRYIPAGTPVLISHSFDFTRLYDELIVPVVFGAMAEAEAYQKAYREMAARQAEKKETQQREVGDEDEARLSEEVMLKAREQMQQPEFINGIVAGMEKKVGLKFREEIARCLSHEVTFTYEIPATSPEDKQTHLAAFIGLRDREAAKTAINKLAAYLIGSLNSVVPSSDEEPGNAAQQKEKSDEELKKEQQQRLAIISLLPRESYKQAEIIRLDAFDIAYVEDYLVIADSADTIKRLIDTAENNDGIAREANFNAAMSGQPASAVSRVWFGPKYFDDMLSSFVRLWAARPPGSIAAAPLNLPATVAGFVESSDDSIRLEAFTPIGVAGMFAFDSLSDQVRAGTSRNEHDAQSLLRTAAVVQRRYAAQHQDQYATLDELIRFQQEHPVMNDTDGHKSPEEAENIAYRRDLHALRAGQNNYRYALKLRPDKKGFEATATPVSYGRNGRHSFFIDESGKLRRASKQGSPADASDELVTDDSGATDKDN